MHSPILVKLATGCLLWVTTGLVGGQESATLRILPATKIEEGIRVIISLKFGTEGGRLPLWVVDPRDSVTGAFEIRDRNVKHGRIVGSTDGDNRQALMGEVVIPGGAVFEFAYTLSGFHEIYSYAMDKSLVNVPLSISHEFWPGMAATFKITDDGQLIVLSRGELDEKRGPNAPPRGQGTKREQAGAGQPATAPESKPEGGENTKPESGPAPR